MNIKRISALLLAVLMVFAISGCKKNVRYESVYSYYDEDVSSTEANADGAGSNAGTANNNDTASTKKPATTQKPGQNTGIVANVTNTNAADWGIGSGKGIESKVNFSGKTIKMACFATINYQSAAFQRAVKAFESKYKCTVKIDYFAFGSDYNNAIRNAIAANKPYDIAFMHASWSYNMIASNSYQPLNDSLSTADLLDSNKKGIDLNKSAEISWGGKIYGVCGYNAVNPMIIFYNKAMFDRAGLEDPRTLYNNGQWTWDKFFELGSKVVNPANDIWFGEFNFFRPEICSTYGGSPVTIVGGTPKVTISDNKYVEGMKLISKLGSGATKIIRTQNAEDQLENFLAGKTYVYTEESDRYIPIMNRIGTLSAFKKSGDNLGIVPFPLGSTNTEQLYPTGWIESACSPKGSDPKICVAWMKFFSTYNDPVSTDKTKFNSEDQKMIDKLLEKILPRRCGYSDSSWSLGGLEWNLVTEAARGNDLAKYIAIYEPQMQSCIDATLSNLNKLG